MESDIQDLLNTVNRLCQNIDLAIESEKLDTEKFKLELEGITWETYKTINNLKEFIYERLL